MKASRELLLLLVGGFIGIVGATIPVLLQLSQDRELKHRSEVLEAIYQFDRHLQIEKSRNLFLIAPNSDESNINEWHLSAQEVSASYGRLVYLGVSDEVLVKARRYGDAVEKCCRPRNEEEINEAMNDFWEVARTEMTTK